MRVTGHLSVSRACDMAYERVTGHMYACACGSVGVRAFGWCSAVLVKPDGFATEDRRPYRGMDFLYNPHPKDFLRTLKTPQDFLTFYKKMIKVMMLLGRLSDIMLSVPIC